MEAIHKHHGKFVVIPDGEYHGVYEFDVTYRQVAPPEHGEILKCHCCSEPMHAAWDIVQQGFWEDRFETYFVCVSCKKAVLFLSTLSRIETKPKRKSRREAAV